ncbi:MAG: type II toxin-antitoxin system HicA family toxin [Oscillospiraceae bacterium]|jgi:hypothetical protein|nr:type II toxin-antitoxin system HicA family toxin [Oscillospiraceae bacterium]
MAEYGKKVRAVLTENKCVFKRRGKGDHDIWYSPVNGKTFPVDGEIKSRHTANAVLKQSGIAFRFK